MWLTALNRIALCLAGLLLGGCAPATGDAPVQPVVHADSAAPTTVPAPLPAGPAPPPVPRQSTRAIEQDPDGDGIANYRVLITEVFDASGNLLSRSVQEDFDADGIVDARETISFQDVAVP